MKIDRDASQAERMVDYEFTDVNKAHMFHAEAEGHGRAIWRGCTVGYHPDTWTVGVSAEFDRIVEQRKVRAEFARRA